MMYRSFRRKTKKFLQAVGIYPTGTSYKKLKNLGSKHFDSAKLIDRWLRYEKVTGLRIDWKDKCVLELGGGPVLGWALLAIACGAKQYLFLEPAFNREIFKHVRFLRYFKEHRMQLQMVLGKKLTYKSVEDIISDKRLIILKTRAENTSLGDGVVDLVISNSFFEHVSDVSAVVTESCRVLKEGGDQYHMIDFQNHGGTLDPFEGMYDISREEFLHQQTLLNSLRSNEFIDLYKTQKPKNIDFRTYMVWEKTLPSLLERHSSWSQFSEEELKVGSGILHVVR